MRCHWCQGHEQSHVEVQMYRKYVAEGAEHQAHQRSVRIVDKVGHQHSLHVVVLSQLRVDYSCMKRL